MKIKNEQHLITCKAHESRNVAEFSVMVSVTTPGAVHGLYLHYRDINTHVLLTNITYAYRNTRTKIRCFSTLSTQYQVKG